MRMLLFLIAVSAALYILFACQLKNAENSPVPKINPVPKEIKFATYNVALFRDRAGQLKRNLSTTQDTQIQRIASVIQEVRPDVLVLCEFDYDASGKLLDLFQKNYLGKSQNGQAAITYPHRMSFPSNTGLISPADLDGDGKIALPNDAYGYGKYEGQYAFALLSKYPIDETALKSYQQQLWAAMPDAKAPKLADGVPYYKKEAWEILRVSSKNHVAVPVTLPEGKKIYTLIAHPTPPVFDGPEDRNGLRNYDEIRLLKDIINNESYLQSDQGSRGGIPSNASFVILGDLNADPVDGDSAPGAIRQLLNDPLIHQGVANGDMIPKSRGGKIFNRRKGDQADPAFDTAFFGSRIDYVLPSKDLDVVNTGVFWPAEGEALYDVVRNKRASDHLLVWATIKF